MPHVRAYERSRNSAWRSPQAVVGLSVGVLALLLIADSFGGASVRLGGVMLALPALAAVFASPATVLTVAAAVLPAYTAALAVNGRLTWADAPVALATAALVSAAAAWASAVRVRREHELARSRSVTVQTQQIMLRPLPPRLGPWELSSVYLASDEESTIGGDLYACALVDGRPRIIVGDVQGKGIAAAEVVMFLTAAFRRAAVQHVPLEALPPYLDDAIRGELDLAWDSPGQAARAQGTAAPEQRRQECFATAVVLETDLTGSEVRITNCGHPPPLLLRDGTVRELHATAPTLPLGLLPLDSEPVSVDVHPLKPHDTLLLYTDGLIEARNETDVCYPMLARIPQWSTHPPAAMLQAVQADLRRHARAHLVDDVAMVTAHTSPAADE